MLTGLQLASVENRAAPSSGSGTAGAGDMSGSAAAAGTGAR